MMTNIDFINDLLNNIAIQKQKIIRHYHIPLSQTKLETNEWQQVGNVSCVFVDLENSTQIAMGNIQQAMQIFSTYGDSLVRIFNFYKACYIDIQGDGGFALFDGGNSSVNAYHTSITANSLFNIKLDLGVRIGVDIGTIYVKKVGIRGENKEIWLGSPVNVASKLCNLKFQNIEIMRISNTFFKTLPQRDKEFFTQYSLSQNNISSFYYGNIKWSGIE